MANQLWINGVIGAVLLTGMAAGADAAPITLTFEGIGDSANILNFYNGGTDSQGHTGPNYGLSFGIDAAGLVDSDAGGSGNFAHAPSGSTVMFTPGASGLMSSARDIVGISFFYTSDLDGEAYVFSAEAALLGVFALPRSATPFMGCGGDPTGDYSCWAKVTLNFAGPARYLSIVGSIGIDDLTLDFADDTPAGGPAVPEPTALLLFGTGLAAAARRVRRGQAGPRVAPPSRPSPAGRACSAGQFVA